MARSPADPAIRNRPISAIPSGAHLPQNASGWGAPDVEVCEHAPKVTSGTAEGFLNGPQVSAQT
jgi:hypothetical protein